MTALIGTTKTRLNLREGPGTEYLVMAILPKGARLEVVEDMGDWLNVVVEGALGYVHEDYVLVEKPPKPVAPKTLPAQPNMPGSLLAKTNTRVNLRSGPGLDYEVVTILPAGTALRVFEDLGDWLNVMYGGNLAYVHERYLDLEDAGIQEKPAVESGADFERIETMAHVVQDTELRAGPGVEYAVLRMLGPGETLKVVEDLGDWLSVLSENLVGCISDHAVRLSVNMRGRTTTVLNLRAGPGKEFEVLAVIPGNQLVEILEDMEGWLDVQYRAMRGFVSAAFVDTSDTLLAEPERPPETVTGQHTPAGESGPAWLASLLENTEQRYGPALDALSSQFEIDRSVAAAAVAVECGRRGLNPDGSLVLRFEVHLFWRSWGHGSPQVFYAHFRFDPQAQWQDHGFRRSSDENWQAVHGQGQENEQAAFAVASLLNPAAARLSAAMGAPQIMGFNFRLLGYETVQAMYDSFQASETNQLRGFFDLVHGGMNPADGIAALRTKDFRAFARYYHGEEKAEKYAGLIRQAYELSVAGYGARAEMAQRKPIV